MLLEIDDKNSKTSKLDKQTNKHGESYFRGRSILKEEFK